MALNDGLTLMHEHMSIALSPEDMGTEAFDMQCRDLEDAYRYGVRNVVDLTNQTMGRSPEHVRRLAEETGMNIIMSTGYYFEEFFDPAVMDRTPEDIAEEAVRELTEGIADSGIRAGIIGEIAWSLDGPYENELKAWEGMCIAARRTGAAVSTHPSRGIQQIPQAEYLMARGIPPEKIVIGHSDFCKDDELLKKLSDMGVLEM
jgi:phosphotriesterase-related protein